MTAHREADLENPDTDVTVKMPRPTSGSLPEISEDSEDFDPDRTLVREDWESTVVRRVAPHVAAVRSKLEADQGSSADERFGWESVGIRRLADELQKNGM